MAATCSVCLDAYNAKERRPKVLPCGHTVCQSCAERLPNRKCPIDRKSFSALPVNLPDNYTVLELCVSGAAGTSSTPRLWCRHCNGEASEDCADQHPALLCSVKKARTDRAAQPLATLQSGEVALNRLRAILDAGSLTMELKTATSRVSAVLGTLQTARRRLQAALEMDDEANFEAATKAVGTASQEGLARDAALLLPALCDPDASMSITLKKAGSEWTSELLQPQEVCAASLLLCELLCNGKLHHKGHGDEQADAVTPAPATVVAAPRAEPDTAVADFGALVRRFQGFRAKPLTSPDGSLHPLIWECTIPGKEGGLWEGGLYRLKMIFNKDPTIPPRCKFEPTLFHPNVFPSGTVSSPFLRQRKDWKSAIAIVEALVSVQDLLETPNFNEGVQFEAIAVHNENPAEYERRVRAQARSMAPPIVTDTA